LSYALKATISVDDDNKMLGLATHAEVEEAIHILKSAGVNEINLCHGGDNPNLYETLLRPCDRRIIEQTTDDNNNNNTREEIDEEVIEEVRSHWFYILNTLLSFLCVTVAALAAGLTMGLLSLEELDLKIKMLTAQSELEKNQASSIMPLLKDHHRLLVTLLLCNALANEALPLFLDELVPSYVAVILSVTLVLFFGEIIPSAIFSGPNKVAVSSKLAPLVRIVLIIFAPLAVPIGKCLDAFFHDEGEHDSALHKYDRKELSALVKIQYEERMVAKKHRKMAQSTIGNNPSLKNSEWNPGLQYQSTIQQTQGQFKRQKSMNYDEVAMVQGALEMRLIAVSDVMTPLNRVYALPSDTVLDENTIIEIHAMGHSRIPIYTIDENEMDNIFKQKANIIGIFYSRQIMVINSNDNRNLSTMPLKKPLCIHPGANLTQCINLLQTSKGHIAVVCTRPDIALSALSKDVSIPREAGVVGIVTLEDCLEELIQEEIYDEFDSQEIFSRRAFWAYNKWKDFTRKKQEERVRKESGTDIVEEENTENSNEETNLLV